MTAMAQAIEVTARSEARFAYLLDRKGFLSPLFVAPAIVYMGALLGIPFILALYFSLTNISIYNLGLGHSFVGLDNFIDLWDDGIFLESLRNTFVFAICSQTLALVLGKILALMLLRDFKGKSFVRVLILLPWAVPIALGVLGWKWMYDSLYSIINWTLERMYIIGPPEVWPQWLGEPNLAMISIIIVHAWKTFPFAAVIFLAAIQSVPQDIVDASKVDGAGYWRHTFQVILPIIAPIVVVGLLYGTVFAFTDLSVVYLLTKGGPINSTHVLGSYAFQVGINSGDIARGAAISIYLMPILLVAMVLTLRAMRRRYL